MLRTPLLSVAGKLRMGMEYFVPPKPAEDDESVGSFLRRRIGREATERIAAPLMAGIYMADPNRLSIQSTFPMFAEMERKHGSMMKAMLHAKKSTKKDRGDRIQGAGDRSQASPHAMFNSLRDGMGTLATTLFKAIQGERYENCAAQSLRASDNGWQLTTVGDGPDTLISDDVVFAVPAYVAARLIEPVDATVSASLDAIGYASSVVVVLGYEKSKKPMTGFGFIVPPDESSPLQACTWLSNKFEGRAPDGGLLVRAFLRDDSTAALSDRSDDELIATARDELARLVDLQRAPTVTRVFRWRQANPQYDVGHASRVDELENKLAQHAGLHLAGSPYHGIGIPDCIASARCIVEKILSHT